MKFRPSQGTLIRTPALTLRRLALVATAGVLAGSAGILVTAAATPALADSVPYTLACTSGLLGNFTAPGIVTTGSLSENPVPPGGSETLNNYGMTVTIPASVVNTALGDGATSLTGSVETAIDATNILPASTPETLTASTGQLEANTPLVITTLPLASPPAFTNAAASGIVHVTQDAEVTLDVDVTASLITIPVSVTCTTTPTDIDTAIIGVPTAPQIVTAGSDTVLAGSAFGYTIGASGTPTPGLSLSPASTLPAGVTLTDNGDGTATLAGTSAVAPGVYTFTVTAQNGVSPDASQSFTLTVLTPVAPTITSTASDTVLGGSAFNDTITATGTPTPAIGVSPQSTLPAGVTLTDNGDGTATLAGTSAVAAGVYTFTVTARNGVSPDASQSFTLTVLTPVAPQITSAATDVVPGGSAFSYQVTATGTPTPAIGVSAQSTLPAGVTLTDNGNGTATLAGTSAVAPGVYAFTIQATNSINPNATQAFILTVAAPGAPQITSPSAATITAGTAMTGFTVTTNGFPAPSLSKKGALPAGVTFVDNLNGTATISGNPRANQGGTYVLTITATNSEGTATQTFTLTVDQAPTITSHASTTFTTGGSGTFTVATTGFPAPALTYTGALPPGVSFVDNHDGTATISGIPTADGSYPILIAATNVTNSSSQLFTINVDQAVLITSAPGTTVTAGTAMAPFTVTTSGFPAPSLSRKGALPSGVTFVDNDNGTATISGVPKANQGGTYVLTITANNGLVTVTQTFTLVVDQAPTITSHTSAAFTIGDSATFTITTTGFPAPALTYTGALPPGVSFVDNLNGTATISGVPTAAGSYPLVITATNAFGAFSESLTLKVS
jgi:large repetitive protein